MQINFKTIIFIFITVLYLFSSSSFSFLGKKGNKMVLTKDFMVKNNDLGSAFSIYPDNLSLSQRTVQVTDAVGNRLRNEVRDKSEYQHYYDNTDSFLLKKGTIFIFDKKVEAGGGCENPKYYRMDILYISDKEFEKEFMMNAKIYSPHDKNSKMFILTLYDDFINALRKTK